MRKRFHNEGGFGAFGLIGGSIIISIGISISYFVVSWMNDVKAERARARNPRLYHQEKNVADVKAGEEFGSFVITFRL